MIIIRSVRHVRLFSQGWMAGVVNTVVCIT